MVSIDRNDFSSSFIRKHLLARDLQFALNRFKDDSWQNGDYLLRGKNLSSLIKSSYNQGRCRIQKLRDY